VRTDRRRDLDRKTNGRHKGPRRRGGKTNVILLVWTLWPQVLPRMHGGMGPSWGGCCRSDGYITPAGYSRPQGIRLITPAGHPRPQVTSCGPLAAIRGMCACTHHYISPQAIISYQGVRACGCNCWCVYLWYARNSSMYDVGFTWKSGVEGEV